MSVDKKTGFERYLEQRMKDPEFAAIWGKENGHDPVAAPSHYTHLAPEPLDVIEAWGLDFHRGQVLKYIARAGHKDDEVQDLRKAAEYLRRKIALLEAAELVQPAPTGPMADALRAMFPADEVAKMAARPSFPARFAAVLKQYPRERPQVTVEPGNNPDCTDRGNFAAAGQTGDCSTVPDDEECPWQSQACDSCKEYYGIGKSHS